MDKCINDIIKFDLHIHSKASEYKEYAGIVDNSTKENLPILFEKLNENNVALFSITDHNRFDSDLYKEIKTILNDRHDDFPNVLNVLAGVEFDVKLEDDKDKCHVITIFDAKSNDDYEKIENSIEKDKLTNKNDFYSKDRFRNILFDIGLNTILIASQTKSISNKQSSHNALNDSTDDVEKILKVKYINALEFQTSKVEGILLNDLRKMDLKPALISGSDCHDWSVYPKHDKLDKKTIFQYSEAKMLPTFKGLLMAITSPNSRFNCNPNNNSVISSISINETSIPLVNGINVIIGENGSGKSALLECINNNLAKSHVKKISEENHIKINYTKKSHPKYIRQGQIAKEFNEHKLFEKEKDSKFIEPDNSEFISKYQDFSNKLKKFINENILKNEAINNLNTCPIKYNENLFENNYYIHVTQDIKIDKNSIDEKYHIIDKIFSKITQIKDDDYFKKYEAELSTIETTLSKILKEVKIDLSNKKLEIKSKNIIINCIDNYLTEINAVSTAKDKLKLRAKNEFTNFIDSIYAAVKYFLTSNDFPNFPNKIAGIRKNPDGGFSFNCETEYHNKDLNNEFIKYMFNQKYHDISKIKEITTKEELKNAIKGCTNIENIDNIWDDNYNKFITNYTKYKKYILDENGGGNIGNTMGEMSLAYYEYYTQDKMSWDILIIDQPEDNISNNNIRKRLLNYFSNIRENKQIIFVTHNPLLVVNLDADNVICIKNINGKLNIDNGCLEYEDNTTNILEIIANIMDGGRETIERRLDVYGKTH